MKGRPVNGRHPNFKGGKSITSHKYVIVFVGKHHHLADKRGYAYEHRLAAERKIGRRLLPKEVVHHKNGNTLDNSHDNILVKESTGIHLHEEHSKGTSKHPNAKNYLIECECGCGTTLLRYDANNRPRRFISGHNAIKNGRAQ